MKPGDLFILSLIAAVMMYGLIRALWNWLTTPRQPTGSSTSSPVPARGEVFELLEANGFHWISGKEKLPISIQAGDKAFESRLFFEGIAVRQDRYYAVKVSRSKKPLHYSGAAIRDALLPYQLILGTSGVVYVDLDRQTVKIISFQLESRTVGKSKLSIWPYLVGMVIGAWLTYALVF